MRWYKKLVLVVLAVIVVDNTCRAIFVAGMWYQDVQTPPCRPVMPTSGGFGRALSTTQLTASNTMAVER